MVVKYRKKNGKTGNMTEYVFSVTWTGERTQVSRTCSLEVISASNDKNVHDNLLSLADSVILLVDDKIIFRGEVTNIIKKDGSGTVTYEAKDILHHLLRSNCYYNFKNKTAEYITRKVCADAGLKVSSVPGVKISIKKIIADDWSMYKTIIRAWYKTYKKNGKRYHIELDEKNSLKIVETGRIVSGYYLSRDANITSCEISESSENVVNRVVIYNDKNKKIGTVGNDKSLKKYGLYQETYHKEKDVDSKKAAKQLLRGIEQSITVSVVDPPVSCKAGNGIKVHDEKVGLTGIYWIESDTHTWQQGTHTAELTLSFKKIMESGE